MSNINFLKHKIMKNVILAISLMLVTLTFAQKSETKGERGSSQEMVEKRLGKLKAELNLTDDQMKQIKPIMEARVEKMKSKKESQQAEKAEKKAQREAMKEEMKADDEKMKKILTPEQYEKWKALRNDDKEKMKEKIKERRKNKTVE
jgi:protein CpxP